ncbi:MAG TPA: ATP-binding protein [Bacteroidales bacterium]|nr:ATP-binding protein [Bacteroidales bacterium]
MKLFKKTTPGQVNAGEVFKKYTGIRSSIYGRVVFIITLSSLFLFVSFGIIFRSVYEQNLNKVLRQNGNNIGSVVEGSLYISMMENNKSMLQSTLDNINNMSGIDDVSMYDASDRLVYSSATSGNQAHSNPDCLACHETIKTFFPPKEKSYRIIKTGSDCIMNQNDNTHRHLLIRSPVRNEPSCYTADCHAHSRDEEMLGSLIIKLPLREIDNVVEQSSAKFFLLATSVTLILISMFIVFTRRQIKEPLNEIVRASRAVASGNNTTRLKLDSGQLTDMQVVSTAFNEMLDNLQAAHEELRNWTQQLEYKVQRKSEELGAARNELIHIERIASLGKLSSSVAHELNNPLSGILVYTKLIHKQLSNPEVYASKRDSIMKHLTLIEAETKRCGEIVRGLLDFSRKEQEDFEIKHVNLIMNETFELMHHPVTIANIKFIKNLQALNDRVFCSANQIKQACVALIVNATEAVLENGEITISTFNPDSSTIQIDITDNGIGIPEEDIAHLFEPFFSTKRDTSGIGLGLAIVHGIVNSHNGKVSVKSKPGKGTTMSVILPLATT